MAGPIHGAVLHDGVGVAVWRIDRDRKTGCATLVVNHVVRLTKRDTAAIAAEGRRFLRFTAAEATGHEVRFVAVE